MISSLSGSLSKSLSGSHFIRNSKNRHNYHCYFSERFLNVHVVHLVGFGVFKLRIGT